MLKGRKNKNMKGMQCKGVMGGGGKGKRELQLGVATIRLCYLEWLMSAVW